MAAAEGEQVRVRGHDVGEVMPTRGALKTPVRTWAFPLSERGVMEGCYAGE